MQKADLAALVARALAEAQATGDLPAVEPPEFTVEIPKNRDHGDWATNIAMSLARPAKKIPREIAAQLIPFLMQAGEGRIDRIEIAGPGFLNFYLKADWAGEELRRIVAEGERYGCSDQGQGRRVQVEFVSANPTGPIHAGNARGGAIGDVLANLLSAIGYRVEREYYFNDALNSLQVQKLGASAVYHYLRLCGAEAAMPEDGYRGDYVVDIAKTIYERDGDRYVQSDPEERAVLFSETAEREILQGQKDDLKAFGIEYDVWFSERALHESGKVKESIELMRQQGYTYEADGALWLRSTAVGDDKDRVIVRSNGLPTYIASEAAYNRDKFERGFSKVIDVWGPDHHGYIARTKAVVLALGYNPDDLEIVMHQIVRFFSQGKEVRMSKRGGEFVTLAEVLEEIGKDSARFFYLMRSADTVFDFDLELAKKQTDENPVYYIQYAHARICSILRQAEERGVPFPGAQRADLTVLGEPAELELIRKLASLPDEIREAATTYEPHRLTRYAIDLAILFHQFYTVCRVLGDDPALTAARLVVVEASRWTLRNVLTLLGVSAPERM
ncbi:MAG: arginine--tRNA ligase [Armatimonadetes bacterium]|nr:arginine--tRNA ligase [Armatimonadota bacterium]